MEQKPARKQGAPNRCCHRTIPTVSASSITIRQRASLRDLIEAIPEEDWTPIPYWMDGAADVAETTYTPFQTKPDAPPARLIVRRVKPTPGSQLALFARYSSLGFWLALLAFGTIGALHIRYRDTLQNPTHTIAWVNTVLGQCKDRRDGLQVLGDMVYTSGNLLTSGSGPRKSTSAIGCVMNQPLQTPSVAVGRSATGYPCSALPTLNTWPLKLILPSAPTFRIWSPSPYSIGGNVSGKLRGLGA